MAVDPIQLDQLKAFVESRPPAESWKFTPQGESAHASRYIKVTDDFGWTLMLFPDGGAAWRAYCGHVSEQKFTGALEECAEWLDRRGRDAERLRQNAHDLWTFSGRQNWRYVERGQRGRPHVRRVFEFPEVPDVDRVCLFLTMAGDRRREPFTGQVQFTFSAGPEESITGELGEVTEWLIGWEKTLLLPAKLRKCSDYEDAQELAKRATAGDVSRLAYLFDFHRSGFARQELIQTFAPVDARTSR